MRHRSSCTRMMGREDCFISSPLWWWTEPKWWPLCQGQNIYGPNCTFKVLRRAKCQLLRLLRCIRTWDGGLNGTTLSSSLKRLTDRKHVTWKHFIVFLKNSFCTMFLIKEAQGWLFYSCGNALQQSQWNIGMLEKRSEVRAVWTVCGLPSGLSSGSQFQLQSGFEPRVKQLLSSDGASFHLRRRVVDSAPFSENLNVGKKRHIRTRQSVCVW